MSEYKSPINVTFDDISNEVINRYDNEIICSVKKITEIDVNKERLINALLLEKNLVHCKDCKYCDRHHLVDGLFCYRLYGKYNKEYPQMIIEVDADDFCSRGDKK